MVNALERHSEAETDRTRIEAELNRLLGQKRFAGAPMMSAFLRYIVMQKLDGNADRIKAYTIGVDALGKPDSFDAQLDPSVRVLALRLRKTLKATYDTSPAHSVCIELKVGSYIPEFYKIRVDASGMAANEADSSAGSQDIKQPPSLNPQLQTHLQERSSGAALNQGFVNKGALGKLKAAMSARILPLHSLIILIFLSITLLYALLASPTFAINDSNTVNDDVFAVKPGLFTVQLAGFDVLGDTPDTHGIDDTPTLMIMDETQHSARLQQLSSQLASSVFNAGGVNVVFNTDNQHSDMATEHQYTMLFSEVMVDEHARIEAQVLRSASGSMVFNTTLLFDPGVATFTVGEISDIEQLAEQISYVDGPLYQDFCKKNESLTLLNCQSALLPGQSARSGSSAHLLPGLSARSGSSAHRVQHKNDA